MIVNHAGREATVTAPATLYVSQADVGVIAILSWAGVNSVMADFQRREWLKFGYGNIIVTDPSALAAFVHGD